MKNQYRRGLCGGLLVAASFGAGSFAIACSQSNGAGPKGGASDDASMVGPANDAASGADSTTGNPAPHDSGAGNEDAESGDAGDGGSALPPDCITPTTPQSCAAPELTALPICKLSQTGCMDSANPTQFVANAVYYEVNSPLWSDNAAKTRAFVLPADGGTIHVKDCLADASAAQAAECVAPNGIPNGPADTGKWVFPVGTVMIKNFIFDGKLVETRLLMRVDAATAAIIQNTTDWVGYNYAWNEAQTEATIVLNARTEVSFNTGPRTIQWNYPDWLDCITCHAPAVGTLGPETDQMNREVDGGNQIDRFVAMGLFDDTAPTKPYAAPLVEPYANAALGLTGPPPAATADQEARSYLAANCGFCHRPDVNDLGFDLRYPLSLYATGMCDLVTQTGIPAAMNAPDGGTWVDFVPGDHAASALWARMNIPVPASDPGEEDNVGRMPELASFVVDTQATNLIASWIDSVKSCPGPDGGQ
jgi:cytochrome c551/c552